jgi:hypothetical protein
MRIQDMEEDHFLGLLKRLQIEHLEPKIKEIVKAEFDLERQNFWVPAERHYREHTHLEKCVVAMEEKEANHAFVSAMRKRGNRAGEIAFYLMVAASCVWAAATFWGGFIAAMQKLLKPSGI